MRNVQIFMMRVLISGAGVAGPTLAYWLARYGFKPTIIEAAPGLRTGGYIIDFWGAGYDIADRMGLLPEILSKGYKVRELRVVGQNGYRVAGFPVDAFFRMTHGRYISVARSELAASIFNKIDANVETIFADSVDRIDQTCQGVRVTFRSGGVGEFDLVVGADGLHSRVRELAFGAESKFEKYLGLKVAAFQVEGYRPRDELVYILHTEVGQQVGRFTMHDDRTLFLFTFADDDVHVPDNVDDQKAVLRTRFGNSGWECPHILKALDSASDFYFDRVSQIRMPQQGSWTRGRVTMIGDAAFCVSLLAGQGSALAMVAAYILAGELRRSNGDYAEAFRRYQNLFGPLVLKKQKAALRFAGSFAPKSKFALFLRNELFNLMARPWIADLALGSSLADKITIPDYQLGK
jgi:2-polyprenyl-6-methoxyphenol hydroxylase-like FAD-dependent oxidoreductase